MFFSILFLDNPCRMFVFLMLSTAFCQVALLKKQWMNEWMNDFFITAESFIQYEEREQTDPTLGAILFKLKVNLH